MYLKSELGEGTLGVMKTLKNALDPRGIMNPGKASLTSGTRLMPSCIRKIDDMHLVMPMSWSLLSAMGTGRGMPEDPSTNLTCVASSALLYSYLFSTCSSSTLSFTHAVSISTGPSCSNSSTDVEANFLAGVLFLNKMSSSP